MTTAGPSSSPQKTFYASVKIQNQKLALDFQKKTQKYRLALIDTSTGRTTKVRLFQSPEEALANFLFGLTALLHMDGQAIAECMIKGIASKKHRTTEAQHDPEGGTFSLAGLYDNMTASLSASNTQPTTPDRSDLTPSSFYTAGMIPEWLEATKSFLVVDAGVSITKGEHYRLLAMNLTRKLPYHQSTVHLQDHHGRLFELPLSQVCSCFIRGKAQNWKHTTRHENKANLTSQ